MTEERKKGYRLTGILKIIGGTGLLLVLFLTCACGLTHPEVPAITAPAGSTADPTATPSLAEETTPRLTKEPTITETVGIIRRASDLPRDGDGLVTLDIDFDQPIMLSVTGRHVNLRDAPSVDTGKRITGVTLGQQMMADGVKDGWFRVTVLPGQQEGYLRSDFADDFDPARIYYAHPPREEKGIKEEDGSQTVLVNHLVDLREYVPDMVFHLVFATPDNYMDRTLYARDVCLLQKGTAEKLARAQERFKEDGYRIKIYDGYRPSSVSGELFKLIPDPSYVSPAGKSFHNRGVSVDITLVDESGEELEMPSGVMELNEKARRNQKGMSEEARRNLDYLTKIMNQSGFQSVSNEWWHYTDWDAKRYMVSDIDFTTVDFIERKQDD